MVNMSLAQRGNIVYSPYDTYGLKHYGKISEVIERMTKDGAYYFEIMLVDLAQYRNKTIAYHIAIDTMGKMHAYCLYIDSVKPVLTTCAGLIDTDSFYLAKDSIKEFYSSICQNSDYPHQSSALLLSDHKTGKYVNYYSLDGRMLEALDQSTEYPFLKVAYSVIKEVFQRLNLYRRQSFFPS
jgi:hypothetical protein